MSSLESHNLYSLPEEVVLNDGEFVEFSVGKPRLIVRSLARGSTIAKDFNYVYPVETIGRFSAPPFFQKPWITKKEFLQRLCDGWRNPEHDNLDVTIGLQVVSCPPNTVATGGLGSETVQSRGIKGPIEGVHRTIKSVLPPEFFTPNSKFMFEAVRTGMDYDRVLDRLQRPVCSELSYNCTPALRSLTKPLRLNFPTIITNARYRGPGSKLDIDFFEYLLSAHMFDPIIREGAHDKVAGYIAELRSQYLPAFRRFNIAIDPHSITRIALSSARLGFEREVDSHSMYKAWKTCSDLYKDYISYLEDTFDAPGTPATREDRVVTWYEDLNKDESLVYEAVVDMHDQSHKEVLVSELSARLEPRITQDRVDKAIRGLNLKGQVFFTKGDFAVKPVGI